MNIKVNQLYKMRDGRIARIYALDGYFAPIHGAILTPAGWVASSWQTSGKLWASGGGTLEDPMDIIEEYFDKKE